MCEWQRKVRILSKEFPKHKLLGCENCEYPSQCRYESASTDLYGFKDSDTVSLPEIDLNVTPSDPSTDIDPLFRFYKNDNVTFESILSSTLRQEDESKSTQSNVTDFFKPDRKTSSRTFTRKSMSATTLRDLLKSTEKRSTTMSPILATIEEREAVINWEDLEAQDELVIPASGH